MRKIAVFVEGQTELIIAREMILQKYNWEVDVECMKLISGGDTRKVDYPNPCPDADFHYQIFQIGNDKKVLSEIFKREKALIEKGFERIVGLRDMFSAEYDKSSKSKKPETVLNEIFKSDIDVQIKKKSANHHLISFCFAIMETEAWLLGMQELLERINANLTLDFIHKKTGYDLRNIDPENEFYHPAKLFSILLDAVGINYDKHKEVVESIAGKATLKDYNDLRQSAKCASFNPFYDSLFAL